MAKFLYLSILCFVAFILGFVLISAKTLPTPEKITALKTPEISVKMPIESPQQIDQNGTSILEIAAPTRNVGAGTNTTAFEQAEPLQRIAPLPQPTPPTVVLPVEIIKKQPFERWRLVFNAVATSAGSFDINGLTFILPNLEVLPANAKCKTPDGAQWPCGMVARTALRSLINGKALTCKLPDVPATQTIEAECRLRNQDVTQWLVINGWARSKTDGPFTNDQKFAEQARRGIFGAPPSGVATITP